MNLLTESQVSCACFTSNCRAAACDKSFSLNHFTHSTLFSASTNRLKLIPPKRPKLCIPVNPVFPSPALPSSVDLPSLLQFLLCIHVSRPDPPLQGQASASGAPWPWQDRWLPLGTYFGVAIRLRPGLGVQPGPGKKPAGRRIAALAKARKLIGGKSGILKKIETEL